MTYEQLSLNYRSSVAYYTPNWADPIGVIYNPFNPYAYMGTCGPCNIGVGQSIGSGIWGQGSGTMMNIDSPIVDSSAQYIPPMPEPIPCDLPCKRRCKSDCDDNRPLVGPGGIPICVTPCYTVQPAANIIQLDQCLNPWVRNLPWLQRTYGGRYDIPPRV